MKFLRGIITNHLLKSQQKNVSSTIHIHNLPLLIKREELQEACNEYGTITSCKIRSSSILFLFSNLSIFLLCYCIMNLVFFIKARNGRYMIATLTFKQVNSAIAMVDELHDTVRRKTLK